MTIGQSISEFIIRAEKYLADTFVFIVKAQESGEEYDEKLYTLQDLFSFLVELQTLYNQWDEREILSMFNYWDNKCNLKTLQGAFTDPYRHYENPTTLIVQSTLLAVPAGVGLLYQDGNGNLNIKEDATVIISDYGLE